MKFILTMVGWSAEVESMAFGDDEMHIKFAETLVEIM